MNDPFFTRFSAPTRSTYGDAAKPRFVTQSHALGAPRASPISLLITAAVAVALFWISRQFND